MRPLVALALLLSTAAISAAQQDRLRALVAQAQEAEQADRLEEAERLYQEILRLRPHWPAVELNLGLIYHSQGRYDEAARLLEEVLGHDAALHSARLFRGVALMQLGDYEPAIRALEEYLAQAPDSVEARAALAQACYEAGRYAESALHYLVQLEHSGDSSIYFHLADTYLAMSRGALARLASEADAQYFYLIVSAEELLPAEQRDMAESHLRKAISLEPEAPEARSALHRLLTGETAEGCGKPASPLESAACLAAQGEFGSAIRQLQSAQAASPDPWRYSYWEFRTARRLAQAALTRLASTGSHPELLLLLEAQIEEQNGNHEAAAAAYRKALATTDTGSFETLIRYGKLQCKQGRFEEGLELYQRALALDFNNPMARALLGEVLATLGRDREALPHLREAVAARPADGRSRVYLAQCLLRGGRDQEALQILEAAPGDPDGSIHYLLGTVYRRLGQTGKAREALNVFEQRKAAKP